MGTKIRKYIANCNVSLGTLYSSCYCYQRKKRYDSFSYLTFFDQGKRLLGFPYVHKATNLRYKRIYCSRQLLDSQVSKDTRLLFCLKYAVTFPSSVLTPAASLRGSLGMGKRYLQEKNALNAIRLRDRYPTLGSSINLNGQRNFNQNNMQNHNFVFALDWLWVAFLTLDPKTGIISYDPTANCYCAGFDPLGPSIVYLLFI